MSKNRIEVWNQHLGLLHPVDISPELANLAKSINEAAEQFRQIQGKIVACGFLENPKDARLLNDIRGCIIHNQNIFRRIEQRTK